MAINFDALATKIDNAIASLNANAADKLSLQTQLDAANAALTQANTDLTAAQAKVDELTPKLP